MSNKTVKQHYIPRFFLERFADDSKKLYVYDVKNDKEYEANYESFGYENNLYETKWEDANPKLGKFIMQNDIEDTLAKYDGEFSAFLRDLDRRVIPDQNPNALICNKQEKMVLKRLIANLLFRNPETMDMFDTEEILCDVMKNEEVKEICDMLDMMQWRGGKSVVNAAVKKTMVTEEIEGGESQKFIELLSGLPFMFMFSKSNGFMISDLPVSVGIDEYAIGDNKTCVFLPLSSRYAVLFGNYKNTENNRMVFLDSKNTNILVDGYIKKNVENKRKLYFRNKEQRSLFVSKIKEAYYA